MDKIVTRFGLMAILLLILAVMISAAPDAQATVQGSPHDLSFPTGGGNFQSSNEPEICIFCHTPHNGLATDAGGNRIPLWNRNFAAGSYTVYSNPGSLQATPSNPPTGESLLCMSCHDGVSTLNTLINYGTQNPITMMSNNDNLGDIWIGPGNPPGYPGDNIGERQNAAQTINLSNDHPISFVFNAALITLDAGGGPNKLQMPVAPLKLFGPDPLNNGRLECATCHDPHEWGSLAAGTAPFLRMTNIGSQMCLTCHIK